MASVRTEFILKDVHPKAKIRGGMREHSLTVTLARGDYSETDVQNLIGMLGERVMVTIAIEAPQLPYGDAAPDADDGAAGAGESQSLSLNEGEAEGDPDGGLEEASGEET